MSEFNHVLSIHSFLSSFLLSLPASTTFNIRGILLNNCNNFHLHHYMYWPTRSGSDRVCFSWQKTDECLTDSGAVKRQTRPLQRRHYLASPMPCPLASAIRSVCDEWRLLFSSVAEPRANTVHYLLYRIVSEHNVLNEQHVIDFLLTASFDFSLSHQV